MNKKIFCTLLATFLFFNIAVSNSARAAENVYGNMQNAISNYLNDGSQYSVYVLYPQKTSTPFIYNNQKWRSASMIKVFILATAMEIVKDGNLSLDQNLTLHSYDKVGGAGVLSGYASGTQLSLRTVLKLMITESDNTATNMIIDLIGMQTINDYIKEKNYNDTILQRKMMDFNGRENYSSVRDLGAIFTKIYNHNCVSYECDEIMIEFLLGQTDTECLNAALPNLRIAHKTGALSGLFDEGGIIYGSNAGDIILVMMTENFAGEQTVINSMKNFARYVANN
jgi:beta-lactamase class A